MSDGNSGLTSTFKISGTAASVLLLASKVEVCLPTWRNLYIVEGMSVLHWMVEVCSQILPVYSTVKIFGWVFEIGKTDF